MTQEQAYEILNLTKYDSLKKIQENYLARVKEALQNEVPDEQLLSLYQEAYDVLYEHHIRSKFQFKNKSGVQVMKAALGLLIISISFMGVHQIERYMSNQDEQIESLQTWMINKDESIYNLATSFKLNLKEFEEFHQQWLYDEVDDKWLVVVMVEVEQANDLGALVSLEQFYLEDRSASKLSEEHHLIVDVLRDNHLLSEYYELIPQTHQFMVTFYVEPFEVGESRTLYFESPLQKREVLGVLDYSTTSNHPNMDIIKR